MESQPEELTAEEQRAVYDHRRAGVRLMGGEAHFSGPMSFGGHATAAGRDVIYDLSVHGPIQAPASGPVPAEQLVERIGETKRVSPGRESPDIIELVLRYLRDRLNSPGDGREDMTTEQVLRAAVLKAPPGEYAILTYSSAFANLPEQQRPARL